MKSKIILLLLSLFGATAAFAQGNVVLRGNVIGDNKGNNKVIIYFNKGLPEDSTFVGPDGRFKYSYAYSPGITATLYMEYDIKVRQRVFPFVVITDGPGELLLKDANIVEGLHSGKISGEKAAVDFLTLHKQYTQQKKQDLQSDSMMTVVMTRLVSQFVAQHPDSYAAVAAMRSYSVHLEKREISSIFECLSTRQKQTEEGKAMATLIGGMKRSAIGNKVEDFSLPNPDGKEISFSSLRGKYVLIDFWASWCGPCKASFPHLKTQYAKYKGDRFEILGISIDQNKQAWLDELPKQALPWVQVLDNQNLARKIFAIVGVPTTYLISPDGEILMKEIGFQPNGELQKRLESIFTRTDRQ